MARLRTQTIEPSSGVNERQNIEKLLRLRPQAGSMSQSPASCGSEDEIVVVSMWCGGPFLIMTAEQHKKFATGQLTVAASALALLFLAGLLAGHF